MDKRLLIYYQNVRGLRTKTNTFFDNLLNSEYDIICLTETWLLPGIYDTELFDSRFNVYRQDRDYISRGDSRGGGVLIATRRDVLVSEVTSVPSVNSTADILALSLSLENANNVARLRLFCCYFPPGNSLFEAEVDFYDYFSRTILEFPDDIYLIVGDFNIPQAVWCTTSDSSVTKLMGNFGVPLVESISAFLSFNSLQQFNLVPNNNNKQLDLVMSNTECVVTCSGSPLIPEDKYHPALEINVPKLSLHPLRPPPRLIRMFQIADYEAINCALSKIDWFSCLDVGDIEASVDCFYKILEQIISDHVPCKLKFNNVKYPIWYSSSLIKIIKEKLKFHRRWKTYGRLEDYDSFIILRRRQKTVQKDCYTSFLRLAESKIHENTKHFWRFVKFKKSNADLPDSLFLDNVSSSDGNEISELFNEYFQSVFRPATNIPSPSSANSLPSLNSINLSCLDISPELVLKYLKDIDTNKGAGPDGIPPLFLSKCRVSVSKPLSMLFTLSLKQGIVPILWKKSFVVPIYKSGNKHNIKNYRPISKLSTIPKLFEKILCDAIYPILRPHIIQEQHGFLNKKSTESNLCEFVDRILRAMDDGCQVDTVYTDFSKAFDKISHQILIQKLCMIGVHGDLLRWIESYLRNRSQAVTVKGYCSSFLPVTSGVPQGSHLGPLLFNIFINDIVSVFRDSHCLLYADDMKIYKIIKSIKDCADLQEDLNRLCVYCDDNLLHLNLDKCAVISYSRKRNPIDYSYLLNSIQIKRVSVVKDLGVLLDSGLLFRDHVDYIVNKAFRMLGFILRISKEFKNTSTVILLYNSMVRTILEYSSTVWNPQYGQYIDKLENLQNKLFKYLKYKNNSSDETVDYMTLTSLRNRRMVRDQLFLYKILRNEIDTPYILDKISLKCPRSNTRRNNCLFYLPFVNNNYTSNSFVNRACKLHNDSFSEFDIFHLSYRAFKKGIHSLT